MATAAAPNSFLKFFVWIVQSIPTLIWVLALYFLLALMGVDWEQELFFVWETPLDTGGLVVLVAVVFLTIEITKSTTAVGSAIGELVLSLFLAVFFLILLKDVEICQTQTFLILTALQFVDAVAGIIVMVKVARRDLAIGGG